MYKTYILPDEHGRGGGYLHLHSFISRDKTYPSEYVITKAEVDPIFQKIKKMVESDKGRSFEEVTMLDDEKIKNTFKKFKEELDREYFGSKYELYDACEFAKTMTTDSIILGFFNKILKKHILSLDKIKRGDLVKYQFLGHQGNGFQIWDGSDLVQLDNSDYENTLGFTIPVEFIKEFGSKYWENLSFQVENEPDEFYNDTDNDEDIVDDNYDNYDNSVTSDSESEF